MKRILLSIALCYFSLICFAVSPDIGPAIEAKPNKSEIELIVDKFDPSVHMGALVVDLDTGQTLYSRNPKTPFIPASNMKLFSDAAALLALGPNYRFETELSTNAHQLENGVLNGSVYLYLPGDPSLTTQNIKKLFSSLKDWGITRIQGDILLVSERRDIDPYASGWTQKDLVYSYGAPLAPVVLDENRMVVTVNPGATSGAPAVVEVSPHSDGITLDNEVITKAQTKGCGLSYQMDQDNVLHVRGCIGLSQWSAQQGLAIQNPAHYAAAQINAILKQIGIQLDGKVTFGSKPKHALLLAKHRSKAIAELLADTMKTSDNLYADSLFLHTAATLSGKPVNWKKAKTVVRKFLSKETGIKLSNANFTDGSGLSREDKLTAKQTVELLKFLHNRFPLAYEYIAALPVSGLDGTLKKRLKNPEQQGFVRAKTGTMRGIVSLSGYLYTENGHTLVFAIYINKRPETKASVAWGYSKLIDALCDYFLKQTPNAGQTKVATNAHSRVAFQTHKTQAEKNIEYAKKWRHIELALKRALKGKPVAVIYRQDHLILDDQSEDPNTVWHALKNVNRKYRFSAALESTSAPQKESEKPSLLWIKATTNAKASRTWTLRDSAG